MSNNNMGKGISSGLFGSDDSGASTGNGRQKTTYNAPKNQPAASNQEIID